MTVKKLYVLAALQADASRASFDTKQVTIMRLHTEDINPLR